MNRMDSSEEHLLHVVMNGRVVGDIQVTGARTMRLRYTETANFTPLSVSMPEGANRYRQSVLDPWLEGLLPDRPELLRQWRRRFGVTDLSPFALIRHVGEDVAGAAQFVRPSRLEEVLGRQGHVETLTRGDIAEMLRRAKADLPLSADHVAGRFSLAGAQAKIALHRSGEQWSQAHGSVPSTHILKPAIPGMDDQDLVEHVTMRIARSLGLRVAETTIEEFADERAIVVRRYDRAQDSAGVWWRVHQEDMCQALGVWPGRKYESQGGPSARTVAALIEEHSTAVDDADNRRFAQALIFNWLICGTDAHARNYSLMLQHRDVALAPLYDLNSHLAYSDGSGNQLSMSLDGVFQASTLTGKAWVQASEGLRVEPDWMRAEIERQAGLIHDVVEETVRSDDMVRWRSSVLARLASNLHQWVSAWVGR